MINDRQGWRNFSNVTFNINRQQNQAKSTYALQQNTPKEMQPQDDEEEESNPTSLSILQIQKSSQCECRPPFTRATKSKSSNNYNNISWTLLLAVLLSPVFLSKIVSGQESSSMSVVKGDFEVSSEQRQRTQTNLTPSTHTPVPLPPPVSTLQSLSYSKPQRLKQEEEIANKESGNLEEIKFSNSSDIGSARETETESETENDTIQVISTSKDQILVEKQEDRAKSLSPEDKDIFMSEDGFPTKRLESVKYRKHKESLPFPLTQSQLHHHQRQTTWKQQSLRRQESDRRRRHFNTPWRHKPQAQIYTVQQHPPLHSIRPPPPLPPPPSSSSSSSSSTPFPVHIIQQGPFPPGQRRPPHPPPEDPIVENSFRNSEIFNPPPHLVFPTTSNNLRQFVPGSPQLFREDDYEIEYVFDEDKDEDEGDRRHNFNWWMGAQQVRKTQERGRSHSSSSAPNNSNSLFRSILGVSPYCLHDEIQFNCVLTPMCWMAGGETLTGCDSMLYSCCVEPSIARKDVVATGRGVQKRFRSELVLRNEPECGVTKHRQFSKRIIGGEKAQFAELPWQVHIRISSYQCGGVLLNHWYVATAAHCVHQAKLEQISVHLGEFDTKNTEAKKEPLDSETFEVESITLHPDFRYMLTQPDRFDIALLKLDHPVFYRDNIIPICLPTQDYPLIGKEGTVAGWGKTDNSFGKTGTNILNKVQVPIIDNRKCKRWHKEKSIAVQLHDEMFCAGYKDGQHDACLGDSGGPLVINFEGRWTLIGITSAGFGCAVEKQPGIYHKVSKTASWISKQISQP